MMLLRRGVTPAYSIDLRKRVLRAWDAGMDAEAVAAKSNVRRHVNSAAPHHDLKQAL